MRYTAVTVAILAGAALGATVFRAPIVRAAQKVESVFIVNDDPGRQAFAFFENESFGSNEDSHVMKFTVPTGKRLVIDSVAVNANLQTGTGQIVAMAVQARVNGQLQDYFLAPQFTGVLSGRDVYMASQGTTIYADGDTDVAIFATRNSFTGGGFMNASIQGHLIDCVIGECS